jgi:tryptophan 2,3-dioxygenase
MTTDYEKYIRTDELLALQKPADCLVCHDELQFQIVHQAAELWMKLIAHELHLAVDRLDRDQLPGVIMTLGRVARIQRLLLQQMDVLDTMSPRDYQTVRTVLGNGSGQESPGFKTLLRLPGEKVWPAVERWMARHQLTLRQIYDEHESLGEPYAVCEALVDFDQHLQLWRQRHLLLVFRIIGAGTPSLKGKPSELLERGMKQRFFPQLWDIRDEVFHDWTEAMKKKGHDPGYR